MVVDSIRARAALILLNAGATLVNVGGGYDLFVPSLPGHLETFLGAATDELDGRVAALLLGLLKALGGCLIAVGITTVVLINGPFRRGERWASAAILGLVGIAEGINAFQMYQVDAPFWAPLGFIALVVLGVVLDHVTMRATRNRS